MQFIKHQLPGVIECVPTKFFDERGHFYESYNQNLFSANGISENFVQDNYSFSIAGVVRGLHFQKDPPCTRQIGTLHDGKSNRRDC